MDSGTAGFGVSVAAISRRDGITVRTGFWMAEKCADALIELGADDVFEFAGLGVSLGIVDGESIFEKTLCQAVAPHYIASAPVAGFRETHGVVAHLDKF
jgi:hypothetical protein